MAMDCGEFVFVHIPRTAGKWTRALLAPYKIAEVGEFHGVPDVLEPDKVYFCWERHLVDWVNSVMNYLDRPDSWWDGIKQVNSTWDYLRNEYKTQNRGTLKYWLANDFLDTYYSKGITVVRFVDHFDYLSQWVDYDRLMQYEGVHDVLAGIEV